MDEVLLPDALKVVPRPLLEEYVRDRIRQFSQVYTVQLLGDEAGNHPVERAFNETIAILGSTQTQGSDSFYLRFTHKCRFHGCLSKDCTLCINNPHKRCGDNDSFDECYANDQMLKAKCDADISIELISGLTGKPHNLGGIEVQISIIDGESCTVGGPNHLTNVKELLKSDDGQQLLGSLNLNTATDGNGRVLLSLIEGVGVLPELTVKDKNDTFHLDSHNYASFRLLAKAIQRDMYGGILALDHIVPAVSQKFVVKTQRALNDYRKSEYPHYKDELTKLKFIGSITATRLRDIQAHVADVPFTAIETVEQLKHLLLYADQNRQVENKMLDLLNMKGKHKHKWEYLREVLAEKIVYDDMVHRVWFLDASRAQGLLYACKQGQVNMEKPFGIAHRIGVGTGQERIQVLPITDPTKAELTRQWRVLAENAWSEKGHPGWAMVTEQLELVSAGQGGSGGGGLMPGLQGMASSGLDGSMLNSLAMKMEATSPRHVSITGSGMNVGFHQSMMDSIMDHPSPSATSQGYSAGYHRTSSGTMPGAMQGVYQRAHSGSTMQVPGAQDGPGGLFHFTAQRLNTGQGVQSPSGGTPRSDSGFGAAPNPFGSAAAGTHPLARSIMEHQQALSQGGSPQLNRRSTPSMLGQELDNLRVSSSPNVFAQRQQHGEFRHGDQRTSAPTAAGLYDMLGGGGGGGGGGSGHFDFRSMPRAGSGVPSRQRRLSAGSPGLLLPHEHSAPTGAFDAGFLDLSNAKRPRASFAPGPALVMGPPPTDDSATYAGESEPVPRRPSGQVLYHQESHGRHLPRSRIADGEASPHRGSMLAHDANDVGDHLDEFLARQLPSVGGNMHMAASPMMSDQAGYQHPLSPSQHLSTTMQHALDLSEHSQQQPEQQQQQAGMANPAFPVGNRSLNAFDSDSFNKTISRMLQHSESDSFKHMLDSIDPATGRDAADAGREFASFLESLAEK